MSYRDQFTQWMPGYVVITESICNKKEYRKRFYQVEKRIDLMACDATIERNITRWMKK